MADRFLCPRPLGFHIIASAMTWNAAAAALPGFLQGVPMSHRALAGDAARLRTRLAAEGPAIFGEVGDAAIGRIQALLAGVSAYHRHPYRREATERPVVYADGSLRLLDFGPDLPPDASCVVVVPSLINPSYILDLMPGRSLLGYLADRGLRPLLVDWGAPDETERDFAVSDYIVRRLEPALAWAAGQAGGPVKLVGYCMGGNLAVAAAVRMPAAVSALGLLATPWDFEADMTPMGRAVAAMLSGVLGLLKDHGAVPVDLLQLFFSSLDPTLVDRKFRRFAKLDPESSAARLFVAVEDWVNDGTPLALPVAAECLNDWYGANLPVNGKWVVDGVTIDPAVIDQPALVIVPQSDRVVPPASALALAQALPNAVSARAPGGHVTMVVGPRADRGLWAPLERFLRSSAPAS